MLIVGDGTGDGRDYEFSVGLDAPATIVLVDVPDQIADLVGEKNPDASVEVRNGLAAVDFAALSNEITGGSGLDNGGFDDIVVLSPRSPELVEELGKIIAFRGTLNLVGTEPLPGKPQIDLGRIHYHYTAYVGTNSTDIAAAYGEARNRADLKPDGVTVFVGAGGPMGQMHMQRALESADGPAVIIGSDLDDDRLQVAHDMLAELAVRNNRTFTLINPETAGRTLADLVDEVTEGRGADDVVVTVPVGPVMANAAELLADDGMLVLFAGVPNGTMAPLEMSNVFLGNAQFTGTSGSSVEDQATVLRKAEQGLLSPDRSLAAVGGIEAGRDGIQAMVDGRFAGKIMIFPQLSGLPLTGLADLAEQHPDIGAAMAEGNLWTDEAENLLLEKFRA